MSGPSVAQVLKTLGKVQVGDHVRVRMGGGRTFVATIVNEHDVVYPSLITVRYVGIDNHTAVCPISPNRIRGPALRKPKGGWP